MCGFKFGAKAITNSDERKEREMKAVEIFLAENGYILKWKHESIGSLKERYEGFERHLVFVRFQSLIEYLDSQMKIEISD